MTKEEHVRRLAEDPVYVIMGEEFSLGRKNRDVAKELLDAGVKIIQYREKHKTWREKYGEAKEIASMCKEYGATFIMNDSADIAVACGADGIHVGQDDAPVPLVRALAGEDIFVGLSTNTIAEMEGALADGADYVGFGPMYPTASKADAGKVEQHTEHNRQEEAAQTTSQADGSFTLTSIQKGQLLKVSCIGYEPFTTIYGGTSPPHPA